MINDDSMIYYLQRLKEAREAELMILKAFAISKRAVLFAVSLSRKESIASRVVGTILTAGELLAVGEPV